MRVLVLLLWILHPPLAFAEPSPNPFYPDANTPKLTPPEWVGEVGVEPVAILSIDLTELRNTRRSLIPEELEATLSREAMADLIAFLQQ